MKDPQIKKLIQKEEKRQEEMINLIASENVVSEDVREALGSVFVNKYSEGYPHKRYYGGNEYVDELEELCQERARTVFDLSEDEWAVNVQPLSGSPANFAVYAALVPSGGKIMGLTLSHGGHLTHGQHVSLTGQFWTQVPYELDPETEQLNYEALHAQARREQPDLIIAGFTAYPRQIDFAQFRDIADTCGAYVMVDMSHFAGLVAGGEHPSPFPYADVVTTTTHKTLRGPRGAMIFARSDERKLDTRINKTVFPGFQGGPHDNQIAATAVALREASQRSFRTYAQRIVENTQAMAEEFTKHGWRVVSGGTETHLLLLDTAAQGVSGTEASDALEKEGIIVNKNTIPFDPRSPFDPSGIRIGTAAQTTRGMRPKDARALAQRIHDILSAFTV